MDFYLFLRAIHITAICLSGALFLARGGSSILGANWPHKKQFRILSAAIDSVLLVAATMLWTILPKEVFANNWLSVKLVLVVLYIASGFVVMKQKNPKPLRIGFFIISILIFAAIITIARAHAVPFL